jgi:hypothetical protein
MPGIEVSANDLKRRLSDEQRREVDGHLASGKGVAIYADQRGRATTLVTFGTRDADLPGLPPGLWGGGELHSFVPAAVQSTQMRSPLMDAVSGPPQIRRPRVAPSYTEHPSVDIEMRTSRSPRSNNGYITPGRPVETNEQVLPQQQPPRELSESEKWWRQHIG